MPPTPPIQFLDHAALPVSNLERSVEWYTRVLGLTKYEDPERWGPFPIMVLAGRSGIALFPTEEVPDNSQSHLRHIAFRVAASDFRAWREQLQLQDIDFKTQEHPPFESLYIRDPDGHQIELMAVKEERVAYRRTLVVGDIHGGFRALEQVLERAGFEADQDRLVSLGDVVDGWPESPEVVEFLLDLPHLVTIQGNHDEFMQNYFNYGHADEHWLLGEGKSTLERYLESGKINDPRHHAFFNHQLPYFIDFEDRCFVHGGYDLTRSIYTQPASLLCWDRRMWTRLREVQRDPHDFPRDVNDFKQVFIGHTPTIHQWTSMEPVRIGKVWNLDQGAKVKGKLTVMDVDSYKYWQSDPLPELYPEVNRGWGRMESK